MNNKYLAHIKNYQIIKLLYIYIYLYNIYNDYQKLLKQASSISDTPFVINTNNPISVNTELSEDKTKNNIKIKPIPALKTQVKTETGLDSSMTRHYDPSIGRFLQIDQLGYQDSLNLYQGMNMNPYNFTDPMGEMSKKQAELEAQISGAERESIIAMDKDDRLVVYMEFQDLLAQHKKKYGSKYNSSVNSMFDFSNPKYGKNFLKSVKPITKTSEIMNSYFMHMSGLEIYGKVLFGYSLAEAKEQKATTLETALAIITPMVSGYLAMAKYAPKFMIPLEKLATKMTSKFDSMLKISKGKKKVLSMIFKNKQIIKFLRMFKNTPLPVKKFLVKKGTDSKYFELLKGVILQNTYPLPSLIEPAKGFFHNIGEIIGLILPKINF